MLKDEKLSDDIVLSDVTFEEAINLALEIYLKVNSQLKKSKRISSQLIEEVKQNFWKHHSVPSKDYSSFSLKALLIQIAYEEYTHSKQEKKELERRLENNQEYYNLSRSFYQHLPQRLKKAISEGGTCPEGLGEILFQTIYDNHMQDHFSVQGAILEVLMKKNYFEGTVFDLGSGTSAIVPFSLTLDKNGGKIVCIDRTHFMLLRAYRNIESSFYFKEFLGKRHILKETKVNSSIKIYQQDITQLDEIVGKEGNPNTILISYCFHWLNKGKGVVEKMVEDIHRHLDKGGHFISIEEYPLHIGFEQSPVNNYIRENTMPINLEEELYPLIRSKGFVDAEDTICYDIDTQQRLKPGFDTREHTHVMYGAVFRKK